MWKKCNTFLTSRISVLQLKLVICYYSITAAFCKIVAKLQTTIYLLDCSCVISAKQNWSSEESDYQSLTPSQWASSKCQEVLPLKLFKTECSTEDCSQSEIWSHSEMWTIILLLWSLGNFRKIFLQWINNISFLLFTAKTWVMSFLALRIPELWTGGHLEDSIPTSLRPTPSMIGARCLMTSRSIFMKGAPLTPSPTMTDQTTHLMILSSRISSKVFS